MTPRPDATVTDDELVVVQLLTTGLTVNQVGRRLGISATAVSNRLYRAKTALGTETAVHTVVECIRRGLLPVDTHHARRVRREVAARHASTCRLLQPPVCDCTPTTTTEGAPDVRP